MSRRRWLAVAGVFAGAGALVAYLALEVLPALGQTFDACLADPPYGETSLSWDRWPTGWLDVVAAVTSSLWRFGSLRMYLRRHAEFATWKLSQDVIWRKHNGSRGLTTEEGSR